jgi:hypothetical protein
MARSGGFGTSLNPFGSGTFGNLAAYNIGDSVKDLANYQAEVAWGNGQLSDAAYLDNLRAQIAAADPATQAALSAQNKYDDVYYRINRNVAEEAGLDALIAFDQQTLSTMDPSNLRYRDIQDSLSSELARRRSRDYGIVVDAYNRGEASTESLLAYVSSMLGTLGSDAPDYDQWTGVVTDLEERLDGEKDTQVYQDYQDRKIKPADFIAYVQTRRDAFSSDSPKWDDWNQRLLDAQKNVHDTAHSDRDSEVFRKYNDGTISDKTYLRYLSQRVDDMAPDDPARPEWVSKLAQGTFSLAEDLLNYEVTKGTKPVSALRDFLKDYAATLNPGSAEWRRIDEKVRSLTGTIAKGTSGGGGGAAAPAKGTGLYYTKAEAAKASGSISATKSPFVNAILEKVIASGKVATALTFLTPDPYASAKPRKAAEASLARNYGSLMDAVSAGDSVWLYSDPTKPGASVQARNPTTGKLLFATKVVNGKVVDDTTKPIMTPYGSSYLPVSWEALAQLDYITADYHAAQASAALKVGDRKTYDTLMAEAQGHIDHARTVEATGAAKDMTKQLAVLDEGIKFATSVNDPASTLNLLARKSQIIEAMIDNPSVEATRRAQLGKDLDEIEANPLVPKFEVRNGVKVQVDGWADAANSRLDANGNFVKVVLPPNVYFELDHTKDNGSPDPQLVEYTGTTPWESNHKTVTTNKGAAVFQGEVTIKTAPVDQSVILRYSIGGTMMEKRVTISYDLPGYIAYTDGDGKRVTGYSIDGNRWLMTDGLQIPVMEMGGEGYTLAEDAGGVVGAWTVFDPEGVKVAWSDPTKGTTVEKAWLYALDERGDYPNLRWYDQDSYTAPRTDPTAPRASVGGGSGFTLQSLELDGSLTLIPKALRVEQAQSMRLYGLAAASNREKADAASAARYAGLATVDPKLRAEKASAGRWTGLANEIAYKSDTRSELGAVARGIPQPPPVNQAAAGAALRASMTSAAPPVVDSATELNAALREPVGGGLPPAAPPALKAAKTTFTAPTAAAAQKAGLTTPSLGISTVKPKAVPTPPPVPRPRVL